jgi:VacB/RNase II family 3'-5' exoribonuclease
LTTSVHSNGKDKSILEQIARRAMIERGFAPDYSTEALAEVEKMQQIEPSKDPDARDLSRLLWASIDNDDSLDLDQLTVAEVQADQSVKILVAVADVAALVKRGSAVDSHAVQNTTSVYTAAKTFHMLPEKLSTDLTSLNYQRYRPAIVTAFIVDPTGQILSSEVYSAKVFNFAKLAYNSVAAWLEGKGPAPQAVTAVPGLAENLRLQDRVAQQLRTRRHERGALELQTLEARPVFLDNEIKDLQAEETNRAKQIIEDFMIAANDITARFLLSKNVPSLRRVVRVPKRWDRIVEIAAQYHSNLPAAPDSKALAAFLNAQRSADPLRFPDLSLTIIKLLGPGEYVVESPDEISAGHFGLAVKDYAHSTAPNRRFPDLITQRILKSIICAAPLAYTKDELEDLATHCTQKEDDANKVERLVAKSAAAMLFSSRIGDQFSAICTGAADKGTWVRILRPPIEGRLLRGYQGVDVGQRLEVKLIHTDVEKGFIDFERVADR